MKKLLAWLMSFFIALFNNVDFTQQDNREYDASNVYRLECEEREPDYRTMQQIHNSISSDVSCRNKNFSGRGKRVNYGNQNPPLQAYWFLENSMNLDEISDSDKSLTVNGSGQAIIAPYDCILVNENLAANDCTTMELICTIHNEEKYRIAITGMSKWYCDKNREQLLPHTWENPDKNGKKHTFSAGNVLGYTSEETVITVNAMRNGAVTDASITLRGFFTQQ